MLWKPPNACILVFPTTCIILLKSSVYSVNFLLHILYLFMRFPNSTNNFNFLTEELYILIKSLISQHTESLVLSTVCSTSNAMPSNYVTWNLLYGKSRKMRDKTSYETLLQSNFLQKGCAHWIDDRIHMEKRSIRSPRNCGVFKMLFGVACRSGWNISRGWRATSHSNCIWVFFSYSDQSPIVWFNKFVKNIYLIFIL